jgi:hypothetical protein
VKRLSSQEGRSLGFSGSKLRLGKMISWYQGTTHGSEVFFTNPCHPAILLSVEVDFFGAEAPFA